MATGFADKSVMVQFGWVLGAWVYGDSEKCYAFCFCVDSLWTGLDALGRRVEMLCLTTSMGILGILVSRTLRCKSSSRSPWAISPWAHTLWDVQPWVLSWCRSYDYTQPPVGIGVSVIFCRISASKIILLHEKIEFLNYGGALSGTSGSRSARHLL